MKDLVTMVGELELRGIHFKSLTGNIDTSTAAGRFFFHVMASLGLTTKAIKNDNPYALTT